MPVRTRLSLVALALLAIAGLALAGRQPPPSPVGQAGAQTAAPAATGPAVPGGRAEIALSFAPVVHQAAPAVVSIYATRMVEARLNPFFDDPLFGQLFGDFGRAVPRAQNALGSGVILSPDGIVVSNDHVVGGADEIRVVLSDRREFAADVILSDRESDLAILRLRGAQGLPVLPLADSDQAQVGDLVLAIGNPFGVGQTVSSGIVSALARSGIAVGSGRGYFIQTDAAINPGNSGGALVDLAGRLLGINTAILTRSGGSNGIGFAIPSNLVAQVLAQAQAGATRFRRPWVGVTAQAVDAALAEALDLGLPQGVVLTDFHPQSPLLALGLRPGDVILSVNGEPVNSPPEMMFRLAALGLGGTARLEVLARDGRRELSLALAPAPESPPRDRLELRAGPLRGLVAETVNPAVAEDLGLAAGLVGVAVIAAQDIAFRVGLRAGDVIVAVNRVPVTTTRDLDRVLRDPARFWEVEFVRDGQRSWLRFRL
jgi:Do/DeqQ family serine protease